MKRPKLNIHKGPLETVDWLKHERNPMHVEMKYQTTLDGSRFWLSKGKGEAKRRLRQIAAGSLRVENGLVA